MKYFTKELWLGAQAQGSGDQNQQVWKKAWAEYGEELTRIKPRLSEEQFNFFTEADVHDGELLHFDVIDGSRPAPLSEPRCRWKNPDHYPVRVELAVLDAYDKQVWSISYSRVKRVAVDFPSSSPMSYFEGAGFGDWGYHELTDVDGNFLRHEVLFSSGASILVEFGEVLISRQSVPESGLTNQ